MTQYTGGDQEPEATNIRACSGKDVFWTGASFAALFGILYFWDRAQTETWSTPRILVAILLLAIGGAAFGKLFWAVFTRLWTVTRGPK